MSAKDVDRALAAPISQVGAQLAALPEDQWFDRKSIRSDPKSLAPALVAMANAEGGVLVIGLDNGVVQGIKHDAKRVNDYRQLAIDHTEPPVRCRVEQVKCINSAGEVDALIVIRIDPSEMVHETKKGECFLRIGDESRKLTHDLRQELAFDKGSGQYDGFAVPDITVDDLDAKLVQQFREATRATGTTTNLLKARSLIDREGRVTNAGYLLFGSHPQDLFPQAHIRVLRYLSAERGSGSRFTVDADHDQRIEGPIPLAIQAAAATVERIVPRRRFLTDAGLFEDHPIVPKDAWLEGVVNAVIHRSYSLGGDHIRVEVFPDRVEITSPGRFPGLANPAKPLEISRYARNPRIARVCADLRIGQELGEGIRRIFDEMRRRGLRDPIYTQTQSAVKLTLTALSRLDPSVLSRLPTRSEDVLDILRRADAELGTGEVADALGMSRPAAMTRLRALQGEGLVFWIGKSTRDPRAVWRLA